MPASMMMAVVAGWPKVIGSSREMVATGPIPGSTPMAGPMIQPMKANRRLSRLSATPKPCARFWRRRSIWSVSGFALLRQERGPHSHADVELADEDQPAQHAEEENHQQHALRPVVRLGEG